MKARRSKCAVRGALVSASATVIALAAALALAQNDEETPSSAAAEATAAQRGRVYTPEDFTRFAPRNALDMLNRVPGFSIVTGDGARGLGQASDNVLVNGERLARKSDDVFSQLARITADRVVRIEIVDGGTLGIPGLAGQVADVITTGGEISGRYEYRALWRPRYAETSLGSGEVSLGGSTPLLEWTAAYTHGAGRGGAGGGAGALITDGDGTLTERRDVLIQFVGEFPRVAGTVKWDGPGSMVANFNANYSRSYTDFSNDERREPINGVDSLRDFDNRGRGYAYEIGSDFDLALGPGRIKLIGLERSNHDTGRSDSIFIFDDESPSTGSRFAQQSDSGERIGRAEYRWGMLGTHWQLDAEAAFNRLDRTAQLYALDAAGGFDEISFPGGSGGVAEDRYEVILNHGRTLANVLTMQLGLGGEYSKLAQTGPGGLTRTFRRPKGSLTLAWATEAGLDLSLKVARTVGQLSFGDFLASVNLAQENQNAGNVELVPQQAWEADFEMRKNLSAWGSTTLRLYGRHIDDYIDIVPVAEGLESRGNIAGSARLYGMSLTATINLDPLGWEGVRINANATVEDSSLKDPLTSANRPFSNHFDRRGEMSLRYDLPRRAWALGGGFNWTHAQPYVRLFETGRDFEGPVYTFAFLENKDVFGLTVNLNVFNLTGGGRVIVDRTVHTGLRDRAPISFIETRRLDVSTIYRISVRGSF